MALYSWFSENTNTDKVIIQITSNNIDNCMWPKAAIRHISNPETIDKKSSSPQAIVKHKALIPVI